MNIRVTPGKYLVYCMLMTAAEFILTSSFMGYLAIKANPKIILAASLITNIILYIIYLYPVKSTIALSAASLGTVFWYFLGNESFVKKVSPIYITFMQGMMWFREYLYNSVDVNPLYADIPQSAFAVAAASLFFLLIVCCRFIILTMASGIIILSVMWFTGYTKVVESIRQLIFTFLVFYGFYNYESKENSWRLRKNIFSKNLPALWSLHALCFMFAVFVMVGFMPKDIESLNQKWMEKNIYSKIYNLWYQNVYSNASGKIGVNEKFSMNAVWFKQQPSRLGGAVKSKSNLMITAKVEGNINDPVYLRGSIRDSYTGSIWVKTAPPSKSHEGNNEITGILGNMEKVKEYDDVSITVTPELLITTSIFHVWKPSKVEIEKEIFYSNNEGEIYLDESLGNDSTYKVMSKIPVVYEEDLKKAPHLLGMANMTKYFQLPGTLPYRVKSLTLRVTDKYKTDYEKAVAIERYLRDNYPYTLDTSEVPQGKDFVDYFLFEEKKGYCTYFASAMAVMSRVIGIPSRYVEGLVLHAADKDSSGIYNVMSNRAHAWVELYFEGYGWIRFEPTSSYEEADYRMPEVAPEHEVKTPGVRITPVTRLKEEKEVHPTLSGNKGNKFTVPLWIILVPFIAAALRIWFKMYSYKSRIDKAEKLGSKDAVSEYFSIFEKKLRLVGIERGIGETPREFGYRIQKSLIRYNIDIKSLVDIFDMIRFGNREIDEPVRKKLKNAIKGTDPLIKDRMGTAKYLIRKYII